MALADLIPEAEVLLALEPDELGVLLLKVAATWPPTDNLALDTFLRLQVGQPSLPGQGLAAAGSYPAYQSAEIREAVREAWAWLEGQGLLLPAPNFSVPTTFRVLSRRARRLSQQPDPRKALTSRTMPKAALHPSIREDVWALYHRGQFDMAVFQAMKAVEVAVREASGLPAKEIGTNLMRSAFDSQTGPLTDAAAEKAEREARSALFAGVIGSYKNPHSHRNVALDDPDEAAEIILLANHLLRIVDSRKAGQA